MASPILLAKAGAAIIGDERVQKAAGWTVVAILSPIILLVAFFCALGSGTSEHNVSAVELCFYGGTLPANTPEEYRACIEQMQGYFTQLDRTISAVNGQTENGASLDDIRIKAIFYALYFGAERQPEPQWFADCFVTYEERTRTITVENEDGTTDEVEETYTVAVPIEDLAQVYQKIHANLGAEVTDEHQGNAESIYSLIRYGYVADGDGGIVGGDDVPFIGVDGFCSPIGADWRKKVTSEFGGRIDPITGKRDGHTGMDLAVPTGTAVRAALPGRVTVAKYDSSYGYYVMIDHGGGLSTLYGHNSKLLVQAGQTVQTGDVISLSGSTGRSTGPHLHFEVRVNGQRTNPRSYLP